MKNTLALFGMGLAAVLLSSTAFSQKTPESKEAKKTRHIKMVKTENGKKMEIDTVLTGDDVFIWNGDTLNPVKHIKKFNPSGFDKMHQIDVKVDHQDGKEKVMIFRHKDGKAGEPVMWHSDSDGDMEIITEDVDSLGKRVVVRKRMQDGNKNHMIFLNDANMKHFPPMPPVPPVPHIKMMKMKHSGQIIDLNDPNIISYKKKELSGKREKIEIVRKKSDGNENMNFNFEFDDHVMAPEPPEPPVFMDENGDRKIIRKEIRIEEKKDKKIEEETTPKENK